ncbi:MAG TPA: hypothetical protein VJH24_00585 [Candidatus Bilamarchaeaceae archaeon]|nr:hypothetical protein [Candidatus Bilamarchaeaceae archaeon]
MVRGRLFLALAVTAAVAGCKSTSSQQFSKQPTLTESTSPLAFTHTDGHWRIATDGNEIRLHKTDPSVSGLGEDVAGVTYELPSGDGTPKMALGTRETVYMLTDKGWLYMLSAEEWELYATRVGNHGPPDRISLEAYTGAGPYDIVLVIGNKHIAARYLGEGRIDFSK